MSNAPSGQDGIPPSWPHHHVLGMRLDYLSVPDYVEKMIAKSIARESGYCCVPNVHQCVLCYDEPDHMAIVNSADFVISDSVILERSRSWRFKAPMLGTIKGADMMLELCRRCAEEEIPVGLVGGKDDDVLRSLEKKLLQEFPRLNIVAAYSPPFRPLSEAEKAETLQMLRDSGARFVFVGLGCPKQERWMAEHKGKLNAMMIGVGAAFDFNAGIVKPSPDWVHKTGFEWLYRLVSEPRRLWKRYLSTSPRFLWLLMLDKLRPEKR